jgi:hypothetical protein
LALKGITGPKGRRLALINKQTFGVGDEQDVKLDGKVYKVSDAGVWGTAVLTGRNQANPHFYPNNRDAVYLFDGGVPMKSVDGAAWTAVGITAPTAAPTLAAVSGGTLVTTNQYEVAYTYYDAGLTYESNGAPAPDHWRANLTIRAAVTSTDPRWTTSSSTAGTSRRRVGAPQGGQTANVTGSFDITTPSSFFPDGCPSRRTTTSRRP